jgi:AcrR family transcriptional regulator
MTPDVKSTEHPRIVKSRPYRMGRRAELVDATRQRIVEAAMELHTTIGPARTTISALAETAGVTRVTVYRHFPEEDELFAACSRHWIEGHPPPDPRRWQRLSPGRERIGPALQELYGWYHRHGHELFPIYRDRAALPVSVQEAMQAADDRVARALVQGFGGRGRARRRLDAAARHAVSFWTWRSLTVDQGLTDGEAAELAIRFVIGAVGE